MSWRPLDDFTSTWPAAVALNVVLTSGCACHDPSVAAAAEAALRFNEMLGCLWHMRFSTTKATMCR